jgi:hypothetical protein
LQGKGVGQKDEKVIHNQLGREKGSRRFADLSQKTGFIPVGIVEKTTPIYRTG